MGKAYKIIISLLLIALAVSLAFYFKENLVEVYHTTASHVEEFNKTNLGNAVSEIKRQILTADPLNIGGNANNAIFTKTRIIAETNIARFDNGMLAPLKENAKLNEAAKAKAEDLFAKQYFEHVSPSGVDPGKLVQGAGYDYVITGENLILGNFESEKEIVAKWMASPGHRENILNERFTEMGAAVAKGMYEGHTVWIGVQEFGLPISVCGQPSTTLKSQIDENKGTMDSLEAQITTKKDKINHTDSRSPQYNQLVDEYNQLVNQYNSLNQKTKNAINEYNGQVSTFNQCVAGT